MTIGIFPGMFPGFEAESSKMFFSWTMTIIGRNGGKFHAESVNGVRVADVCYGADYSGHKERRQDCWRGQSPWVLGERRTGSGVGGRVHQSSAPDSEICHGRGRGWLSACERVGSDNRGEALVVTSLFSRNLSCQCLQRLIGRLPTIRRSRDPRPKGFQPRTPGRAQFCRF